jgi:8-oxo-dGTP diphosphatase
MISPEKHYMQTINSFAKKLPHFPDGRTDYTTSNIAPVLTIFVMHKDKLLILKRGNKVQTYKGKWNSVAGYLDEPVPLEKKVLEELREELNIFKKDIVNIKYAKPYKTTDKKINKTWLIHLVLVHIKSKKIKIDWEHTAFAWIDPSALTNYDIVPSLSKSWKKTIDP